MIVTEIIRRKRNGGEIGPSELTSFLNAYLRDEVPDYQMSAFAMAVYFRGMSRGELAAWTDAMLHSGDVLDLHEIPGPKIDKHSTGGVGDKISLPLFPLVAACGVRVPSIAGRGLGHTGGTLDKLEAIPGFNGRLDTATFKRVVAEVGCAMVGQTASLAPADRRLYALRDVTATVESIPLIASSILSKKLAEGLDGLVLDVKFGSGAFMRELDRARELARTMVEVGTALGTKIVALLTNMDTPLGAAVGNALEVRETIDILRGKGPADVRALTLRLGAEMLRLGGIAADIATGEARLEEAIASGAGLAKFRAMIQAQGGDPGVVDDPDRLPTARRQIAVAAPANGFVGVCATDEIGRAAMLLGAGRQRVEDAIDPAVGLVLHRKTGEAVAAGEPLATLHVNAEGALEEAQRRLLAAMPIVADRPVVGPLVVE